LARSFKEAQAYLIPLMLASLGPGLAGMIPGLTLDGTLAVTPLVNIVLLSRDVFEGGATPLAVALVVTSTLLYAVAAIAVAARIFGAEEVLYNEQSSWSDFLSRSRKTQPAASLSNALVCLALMVPINFVLRGIVMSIGEPTIAVQLVFMGVDSVLLFVLLPSLAAYWSRLDWRGGFSLHWPAWLTLAGALLLGLGLWPIIIQVMQWLHVDLQPEAQEQAKRLVQQMKSAGMVLAVPLALAAVTEELFFRGYLFAALQRLVRPLTVIVVTAVLFGVMHSIIGGSIGARQLIPATLMGLVLGCVRWRSGSVLPGMALHMAHNVILAFLLVSLDESASEEVPPIGLIAEKLGVQVYEFLAVVVLMILAGAILVYWGGRNAAKERVAPERLGGPLAGEPLENIIELRPRDFHT
jgi:ABC-2 type transport system permease protein/sodium transport system permease protein